MKPLVEIQNLVKYFDLGGNQRVHAVCDGSLSINPGGIVCLVCESGSGNATPSNAIHSLHHNAARQV